MRIQKNFVLGTLQVVPEEGRLWLETQNCDLRISKLSFKNIEESFSMIDIQGGEAIMLPEHENSDDSMLNFIGSVCSCVRSEISNNDMKDKERQEFLDRTLEIIRNFVSFYNRGAKYDSP